MDYNFHRNYPNAWNVLREKVDTFHAEWCSFAHVFLGDWAMTQALRALNVSALIMLINHVVQITASVKYTVRFKNPT